jgi:hypothetical protein
MLGHHKANYIEFDYVDRFINNIVALAEDNQDYTRHRLLT